MNCKAKCFLSMAVGALISSYAAQAFDIVSACTSAGSYIGTKLSATGTIIKDTIKKNVFENQFLRDNAQSIIKYSVAAGVALIALKKLIDYANLFNLEDASDLMVKVERFTDTACTAYKREFDILDYVSDSQEQKILLQNIILEQSTPRPYTRYEIRLSRYFAQCKAFKKTLCYGITKLIAERDNLNPSLANRYMRNEYNEALALLRALELSVTLLKTKLSTLLRYCWQFDGYKYEKIMAKLDSLSARTDVDIRRPKLIDNHLVFTD